VHRSFAGRVMYLKIRELRRERVAQTSFPLIVRFEIMDWVWFVCTIPARPEGASASPIVSRQVEQAFRLRANAVSAESIRLPEDKAPYRDNAERVASMLKNRLLQRRQGPKDE